MLILKNDFLLVVGKKIRMHMDMINAFLFVNSITLMQGNKYISEPITF